MNVEVEVMSREMIQPSSPTPHHLRHHHLSFLDQINPPVYMPLVLFYTPDSAADTKFTHIHKSEQLKKSLSETLTRFYPLAGRLKENIYIDCNDEGVLYVEAQMKCQLSEVASDPIPGELNKLVPYKLDDVNESTIAIQVTFFDCGGMAIGLSISHKVADGSSFFLFLNTWSAIARRDITDNTDTDIICPRFEAATLFPPKDISGFEHRTGMKNDKTVTKRFVFSASTIAALRDRYTDSGSRPSRVMALSAFIWSRFMAATQAKAAPGNIYTVLHAVNLRSRLDPPLPEYYFGNYYKLAIAVPNLESQEECYGLVRQMRNEISKVNGQIDEHLSFIKKRAQQVTKGEIVSLNFSSFCRFPMYEVDFGWGMPIWVGLASRTFKNNVVFSDTRSGDGIEASVIMEVEDMAKFETDKELLAYVSPTRIAQISGV